jgi:hypothetical protein
MSVTIFRFICRGSWNWWIGANNNNHTAYQEKKKPTWEQSESLLVVIIFSLIWFLLKKIIKLIFLKKLKSNWNWFKLTGFSLVWFFRIKPGSNRFDSVFFIFSGLVFSVIFLQFSWFNQFFGFFTRPFKIP